MFGILPGKVLSFSIVAATVLAALTADGLSGGLVAFGGGTVVLYGLWCAGRDRATKNALQRYHSMVLALDECQGENERLRLEAVRLRERIIDCEARCARTSPPPA